MSPEGSQLLGFDAVHRADTKLNGRQGLDRVDETRLVAVPALEYLSESAHIERFFVGVET